MKLFFIILALPFSVFAGNSLETQCEGYGYMLYNQKIDSVSITNVPMSSMLNHPAVIVTVGGKNYSAFISKEYTGTGVAIAYSNAISEYKLARVAMSLGKTVDVCHYEEILYGLEF
ncbi:hypothetical protein ACK1MO_003420 [Salmonella enterica]